MAVVRTEYDYAISFQSFHECLHQKSFFDLKDKKLQESKDERRARLDEKYIGNDPRLLFNGNHFSSCYVRSSVQLKIHAANIEASKFVCFLSVFENYS